jgi:hypothetical protein
LWQSSKQLNPALLICLINGDARGNEGVWQRTDGMIFHFLSNWFAIRTSGLILPDRTAVCVVNAQPKPSPPIQETVDGVLSVHRSLLRTHVAVIGWIGVQHNPAQNIVLPVGPGKRCAALNCDRTHRNNIANFQNKRGRPIPEKVPCNQLKPDDRKNREVLCDRCYMRARNSKSLALTS